MSCPLGAVGPGSSPHTRGAPRVLSSRRRRSRIIPAYAGSTSCAALLREAAKDHPRIRGEHCQAILHVSSLAGSSPHTRGARALTAAWMAPSRIIPAYAGSTMSSLPRTSRDTDHPRIRGEHEARPGRGSFVEGSSPHTRGARVGDRVFAGLPGIIPAYAGSTRRRHRARGRFLDHPRIRGEHAWGRIGVHAEKGSSPHTRGAPPASGPGPAAVRIIPAYAGSTWPTCSRTASPRDHPRIRGEHVGGGVYRTGLRGSSPHTRGARRPHERIARICRIIPAYAGSTPRTSGVRPCRSGSSPHTRGAPCRTRRRKYGPGIIPAYAGSTPGRRWCGPPLTDHPRIRGEHGRRHRIRRHSGGSSPHTRGARAAPPSPASGMGIIPAYAGSTSASYPRLRIRSDHPRIRGEHASIVADRRRRMGSSPHTRGAHLKPEGPPKGGPDHPRIRGEHD